MSYRAALKLGVVLISLVSAFVISGCDKIPFLNKFFPSLSKETAESISPSVASSVPTVTPSAQTAPLPANALARVGKWTLTVDEFNDKLASVKEVIPEYNIDDVESKKLILEELVRQQLLVQDAEASGVAKNKDITEAVEEFRKTLLVREMASKLAEGITTTDLEARDYYNQNKNAFTGPVEWHIREIMVPTKEEATEILAEIYKGADFAATAQARSKSASAAQGGDLGFVTEFKFPQIETALMALDVGSLSSVLKGPDGYYVIKLEEKKGGEEKKFEDIKDEIKTGLTLMKQQQEILAYIEDLKKKTNVQVNEDLLK